MKKYIFKGICLLVFLVIADFAVGKLFSYLHRQAFEKSPYGLVTEYAMNKVEADVIVIGSSRACHHYVPQILSDSLGMTVHNCGKDGAFFLYQCCMIDGILMRTKPKLIIWDMDPMVLAKGHAGNHRLSDLNPFYDGNDFCRRVIDQSAPAEKYKMLSRSYRYNSRILAYLYKSVIPFSYPEDGYLPLANEGYVYPSLMMDENLECQFDVRKEEYLWDIIQKCKQKEVGLLISFSPCLIRNKYQETEVYDRLCSLLNKEQVEYCDFYNDTFFMVDSTLFKDISHLNDRGARLLTERLVVDCLNKIRE